MTLTDDPMKRLIWLLVLLLMVSWTAVAQGVNCGQGGVDGDVRDYNGNPVGQARIVLSLNDANGKVIWQSQPILVDPKTGAMAISPSSLPNLGNTAGVKAATLTAEGRDYFPGKVDLQPSYSGDGKLTFSPCVVSFRLEPYNRWLTLLFLIPGAFGLLWATIHLTQFSSRRVWVSSAYAVGAASLWMLNVIALSILSIARGDTLIPLFWPDLFVSSGVVIGGVLGSLVYVAFALNVKGRGFFDLVDPGVLRKILRTVGGRVLIAPYVAVVANAVFATAFPSLRSGPFALFFAFFSGLYIKVVLDNLNALGTHFLTQEARQKVVDLMSRQNAPEAPAAPTTVPSHVPNAAFLDAINAARTDLVANNKSVVGVEPAVASNGSNKMVVYLDPTLPAGSDHRVPSQVHGIQTEVKPLPAADVGEGCRSQVLNIEWRKIGKPVQPAAGGAPHDTDRIAAGQVTVLADSSVWVKAQSGALEFRPDLAYASFRRSAPDSFDFVCFVIATSTWGGDAIAHAVGNYSVPVFNNISGINHYKGSNFDHRSQWGTSRLLACQVISMSQPALKRRVFLHELGHAWCSYVTFDDPDSGNPKSPMLLSISDADPTPDAQGLYHWARHFDDSSSCMDYDLVKWTEQPLGTFTAQSVDDAHFEYCALDRYLMGFLPRDQVGQLTILPDLASGQTTYTGRVKRIAIDAVIKSCGARSSSTPTPTVFRQAWVVICADIDSGREFAAAMDGFRPEIEAAFQRATGSAGTLQTSLA